MASRPANSGLAAPAFPCFVGVRESTVNGWSTVTVSLAGRLPASAGARTSFASVPRAPSLPASVVPASVGDFPDRPVGSSPTLLRTEKRLSEMRLAAKPNTRRSRLRAEHGIWCVCFRTAGALSWREVLRLVCSEGRCRTVCILPFVGARCGALFYFLQHTTFAKKANGGAQGCYTRSDSPPWPVTCRVCRSCTRRACPSPPPPRTAGSPSTTPHGRATSQWLHA